MIDLRDLTLTLRGKTLLDGITLRVEPGEPTALLGGNGAGKSLLLRLLASLRPTGGAAVIGGFDLIRDTEKVRRVVGYVGEPMPLPPNTTVQTYLNVFASSFGYNRKMRQHTVDDALALTELTFRADSDLRTLSRGETQRLELARALLHDPPVLLLDEPLAGLDPLGQAEIAEILLELRDMGKTLLIATNLPEPYGDLFKRGVLLHRGQVLAAGTLEELCPEEPRTWRTALLRRFADIANNGSSVVGSQ